MERRFIITLFAAAALVGPAFGQSTSSDVANRTQQSEQAGALTSAEVRKIDKDAGKITLKHEAIQSHDMPSMTMVFRVADPKFLDQVKPGDKVRFAIEKIGGQYTVTQLEATP